MSHATIELADRIGIITMNDGKANAFSFDMMAALNDCLNEAEANADVIVLTAIGGAMCAGFDLKVMRNEPDRADEMVTLGGKLLTRIFGNDKPVIIASPGHAIAGGCLLMLSGDYRIGAEGEARYGLNESAIDMVLPPFGLDLARYKINNKYLDMCFAGAELVDTQTAIKAGFLDEAVAPDALRDRAMEKAQAMQKLSGKAFAGNKKLIRGATIKSMKAGLGG